MYVFSVEVRSLVKIAYADLYSERFSFKNILKLSVNTHVNITNSRNFSKTLGIFLSGLYQAWK